MRVEKCREAEPGCGSVFDREMMRRALQLSRLGYGFVSPNPMVGAVITDPEGRIVGEGFHRCWGGPHAEVNAVASVRDKSLLPGCTVYVTLEPCSHYGKTPPCAKLLIDSNVKRVVVGCTDPFKEVSGRGIAMLRDAGIEVTTGVERAACEALNRMFIYAHTHRRPYVMLKWAQSADGFIAGAGGAPVTFSSAVSQVFMHRERAGFDAIMAGTQTIITDNPHLTCRLWPNRRLRPLIYNASGHVPGDSHLMRRQDKILITEPMPLEEMLSRLYTEHGVTSLLVEGGARLLGSFMESGLYNSIRVERAPFSLGGGVKAPEMPQQNPVSATRLDGRDILIFDRFQEG